MKITYQQAFDAATAMKDIMTAKGLRGASQIKIVRLWRELGEHVKTVSEADSMLASEYGTIGENGVVVFFDDGKRPEFLRRRAEMLSEMVDVTPISIVDEEAFWAASSPNVLSALDGLILFEEEKQ